MRQQITEMEKEAAELEGEKYYWENYQCEMDDVVKTVCISEELRVDLEEAKDKMERRIEVLLEREKELISERLVQSLDKESQAEMADNGWMKREVHSSLYIYPKSHSHSSVVFHSVLDCCS